MQTLLRIDASARADGSHTRALADHFQARWQEACPEGEVIWRSLADDPVPHLTDGLIQAFQASGDARGAASHLSDTLIEELRRADHVLISSPLYNLNVPSPLKAWFDHVVRSGETFAAEPDGYRGLLDGKRATVIAGRGGLDSGTGTDDFQSPYLKAILAFIGIEAVDMVTLEETAMPDPIRLKAWACARLQVDRLFGRDGAGPRWIGEFSDDDRRQIDDLRGGQSDAIVKGDARAYADLCAEDIQLLIPGREAVAGRTAFLEAEEQLFLHATFASFRKRPLSIERSGNLAIEVGLQEVAMDDDGNRGGIFASRQKYTHVFRLCESGWRFAVLMSNPCE
ncbi:NAD(P)H-dependent oxidoreductase [Sedimenticola hydrogenitrophicus]|uniref:NAD(P)H-dependent oxidoreductase n=1 Tax=Sedimenticola hydrogenitrophicus TaxID=2967975 RepID=UPI0021A5131B|nr:NAD(P)H-dependent oxidoreductase [Sedimenticola hydrogenitrophicus]